MGKTFGGLLSSLASEKNENNTTSNNYLSYPYPLAFQSVLVPLLPRAQPNKKV